MDRTAEILTFLRNSNDYLSGDIISSKLGISRTAVWKYINQLEQKGYGVSKIKGKGYKLTNTPDKLYSWEITRYIDNKNSFVREIIYQDNIQSTNSYAFKLALAGRPEGTCVIAETQQGGKGRLNRVWFSPPGKNLYLSVILKPQIHPSRIYPVTFLSSLAVYDTIKMITGISPTLKWPNDVLINEKKVCGTLIELSTEADMVGFVIVGIGLNINMKANEIDDTIKNKATSLYIETKKIFERASVCGMLLSNFDKYYSVFRKAGEQEICNIWEKTAQIKGKQLEINQMGEIYKGIAQGVDSSGAIILDIKGQKKRIIAGDVSF